MLHFVPCQIQLNNVNFTEIFGYLIWRLNSSHTFDWFNKNVTLIQMSHVCYVLDVLLYMGHSVSLCIAQSHGTAAEPVLWAILILHAVSFMPCL